MPIVPQNTVINYLGFSMKSFVKKILKFTSIAIVLFVAIVALINTSPFDEELNPEIVKLMQPIPMPVVEDNAYYALYGLNAIDNRDMIETGHGLTLRSLENRKNGKDELSAEDYLEILGIENNNFSDLRIEFNDCNSNKEFNCLISLSENLSGDQLNNPRLQILLNRYHKIMDMEVYSNFLDVTMNSPLAAYGTLLKLSKIRLATSYKPKNRSEFIQHLHKDMEFWKLLLNQGKLLIDKMVAFASIKNNINNLSEYLRNNSVAETDVELIIDMLTPLTTDELDLSESFITEHRIGYNAYLELEKNSSWFESLTYQPNATINYGYEENYNRLLKLAKLPLPELIKKIKLGIDDIEKSIKLHNIYNYTGKMLIKYSGPAYSHYTIRGHDLNNIIKMVNIQYQAKTNPDLSLEQLLIQPKNTNMYNDKPFEYDKESQIIYFNCLTRYQECRIKL
ncbi:MAG: hypothetical protein AB8B80_09810 [Marinicellaceae bacterium]